MTSGFEALQVLLVEDNAHMRTIVTTLLQGLGLQHVRETRNGEEALEALRLTPVDLALVDFLMAPMDGVEFTRLIRTSPKSPNVYMPVVMMTGHSERSRVCEARDAGVTEFVAKPLTARALALRINAVIHHARPFVRTPTYFGPDRRRRADPRYRHFRRRAGDVQPETGALALD
jgi:two-component system, chemotaxis family, chemotaxis protein CheY